LVVARIELTTIVRAARDGRPRLHERLHDPLERSAAGDERIFLREYASEEGNPGNSKHVPNIIVKLPSPRLSEGIAFVGIPGVGSLALEGGAETYVPPAAQRLLDEAGQAIRRTRERSVDWWEDRRTLAEIAPRAVAKGDRTRIRIAHHSRN
jgi:hypothetical protein